jgi:para-nitrobenzyl esterase
MPETVIVETRYGRIRGIRCDGVNAFLGVPYGRTTAPPYRFLPPAPPEAWEGVRDAQRFGPRAPQATWRAQRDTRSSQAGGSAEVSQVFEPNPERAHGPTSEDCLNLNVWTAAADDGKRRPVMFYFHGGGFTTGSSGASFANGARLAATDETVVVSANHRLGALGFLAVGGLLGPGYESAGVNGMLDLIEALRWVRDNIAIFGGDPERVLVFGESGGGAKVSTILGMPEARGLFSCAAVHSDAGIRGLEASEADRLVADVLSGAGLTADRAGEFLTMSAEEMVNAQAAVFAADPTNRDVVMRFRPVVGGPHLPAHPFDPVASECARDVPLIVGSNKDEVSMFVTPILGDRTEEVLQTYRAEHPDLSPTWLYVRILSDRTVREPAMRLALRKADDRAGPVYAFLLTWETSALGGRLGSPHVLDMPLIFRNTDLPFVGDKQDRYLVSEYMSSAWIAFAKSGNPNRAGLPEWPPYTPENRQTMLLDTECTVVSDPSRAVLDLFRSDPSIQRPW